MQVNGNYLTNIHTQLYLKTKEPKELNRERPAFSINDAGTSGNLYGKKLNFDILHNINKN